MGAYALFGIVSACLALLATYRLRLAALRVGLARHPRHPGSPREAAPRLGGLVIFTVLCATVLVGQVSGFEILGLLQNHGWNLSWLAGGLCLVLAVGIADDLRPIGAVPKLLVQVLAAGMALAGGYGFETVTNPLTGGYLELGPLGPVAALVWIVGITNAFNLIDGLDGLAAGVALIACLSVLSIALVEGRPDAALLSSILGGALAGFLWFNFSPASVFLGDSGSLLVGYLLSLLSIRCAQKGPTVVVLLVPVLTLGLPILETLATMIRRLLVAGIASVFRADEEHIHHRLLALGMSQRRAVLLLYAIGIAFGSMAFLAMLSWAPVNAAIMAVVATGTYIGIRKLGYRGLRGKD